MLAIKLFAVMSLAMPSVHEVPASVRRGLECLEPGRPVTPDAFAVDFDAIYASRQEEAQIVIFSDCEGTPVAPESSGPLSRDGGIAPTKRPFDWLDPAVLG